MGIWRTTTWSSWLAAAALSATGSLTEAACSNFAGGWPAVLHVDDDAPTGGDGTTWATAITHLRDALHQARLANEAGQHVEEIRVAGGLYKPNLGTPSPLEWPKTFVVVDGTAMRGGYRGALTGEPGDPDKRDYAAFESRLSGDILGDDGPPGVFQSRPDNSRLVVLAEEGAINLIFEGFTVSNGGSGHNFYVSGNLQVGSAMRCVGGAPRITHCRFHDNLADNYGGLTLLRPAGAVISHCVFTFNLTAQDGGGLAMVPFYGKVDRAVATVSDCRFEDNRAMSGGGIWAEYYAEVGITDCIFFRNRSWEEGGAICTGRTLVPLDDRITMRRCHFEDNFSDDLGAAVASMGRFDDCDFIRNRAGGGGAISMHVSPGGAAVTNCRFVENQGVFDGGSAILGGGVIANCVFRRNLTGYSGTLRVRPECDALYYNCLFDGNRSTIVTGNPTGVVATVDAGAQATFINCTMTNNFNVTTAGGISAHGTGTAEVFNSILWGNSGAELQGAITAAHSCIEGGWPGDGNVTADPHFVDALGPDGLPGTEDADLRLLAGSPCIDAGDTYTLPADQLDIDNDGDTIEPLPVDLLGQRRVVNDPSTPNTGRPAGPPQSLIVDVGAMEYQPRPRPGDLDGDGNVNVADLLMLIHAWGECPDPARCIADIAPPTGGDAVVNVDDLLMLINHWG